MRGFRSLLGLWLLPLPFVMNIFRHGTLGYIRNIMKSKREVRVSLSSAIVGTHLSIWVGAIWSPGRGTRMNGSERGTRKSYS